MKNRFGKMSVTSVLREGALITFPFKRRLKGNMGEMQEQYMGTMTKEKRPYVEAEKGNPYLMPFYPRAPVGGLESGE